MVNAMANIETLFWDESWVQLAVDGSALVGAALPGLHGASITGVRMPKIGEVVYQGLPLAGVNLAGKPMLVIPAPISGVVAGINPLVAHRPQILASDPCGEGWIAGICATRHEEMTNCKPRPPLLVNADPCSADEQTRKLAALGCQVEKLPTRRPVCRPGRKRRARDFPRRRLAGRGRAEPGRADQPAGPPARSWSLGSRWLEGSRLSKAQALLLRRRTLRRQRNRRYPHGRFRTPEAQPTKAEHPKGPSEPISSISITNRNLHKVQLLAARGCSGATRGSACKSDRSCWPRCFPSS